MPIGLSTGAGRFYFREIQLKDRAACKSDNIRVRSDKILVASPYTLRTGARSSAALSEKEKKKRTAFI